MSKSLAIALFFAAAFLGFKNEVYAQCTGTAITGFTVTNSSNVSCFGGSDGSIQVTLVGGQSPFTYSLVVETGFGDIPVETVSNTSLQVVTFSNLFAGDVAGGTYRVNVITSNGGTPLTTCTRRQISGINITQPTDIAFTTTSITPSCNGNDGAIAVSAVGGTPGYTFVWTGISPDPGNTTNPTGLAPGSYSVTVTDTEGCPKSINGIVVPAGPTVDAGSPQTICSGQTVSLSGSIGGSATGGIWSGGAGSFSLNTDLNAVYTPAGTDLTNGTVTLTLTTTGGSCTGINDQVIITIDTPPIVEAGNPQAICGGLGTTLSGSSVTGVATAAWSILSSPPSGNGTLSSTAQTANPSAVTFTATVAGSYTLRLTSLDPAGSCTAVSDDVIITVDLAPIAQAGPAIATFCSGSVRPFTGASVSGSATTGAWSVVSTPPAAIFVLSSVAQTATPATVTFTPTTSGVYTFRLTTNNPGGSCLVGTDDITITVNPTATVFAGIDKQACAGTAVALSDATIGGSAINGTWSIRPGSPTGGVLSVTSATANPSAVTLTATNTGNYVLRLTTNDPPTVCNAVFDEVTITIEQTPSVEAGNAQAICSGAIATLTGSSIGGSASDATWSIQTSPPSGDGSLTGPGPDATPANATFTATVPGNYVLRLTTNDPPNSCPAVFDEVTITVNPIVVPSVSIAALPAGGICAGTNVTFTATPTNGGTTPVYQWKKNGSNVGTNSTTYSDAGLVNGDAITVEMTSNATCASPTTDTSNSLSITVNSLPTLFTVTGGGAICTGGPAIAVGLTDSELGVDYTLVRGATDVETIAGTGSALAFTAQSTVGTYTVRAANTTTTCDVVMTGSAVVTANPLPTLFTVTGGGAICTGGPAIAIGLTDSELGVDYTLVRGATDVETIAGTGSALAFTAQSTAGTYTVRATNTTTTCDVVMTGSAVVTVNPLPLPALTGDLTVCKDVIENYSTDAGQVNYVWIIQGGTITAGGTGNDNVTIQWDGSTPFSVSVTYENGNGCVGTTNQSITVSPLPSASVTPVSPTICSGSSTNLNIAFTGTAPWTFQVFDGTTTSAPQSTSFGLSISVSPTSTTTYSIVNITDGNGCTIASSGSAVVTVDSPPSTSLVVNRTISPVCIGGSSAITVQASEVGVSYQLRQGTTNIGAAQVGTGGLLTFSTGVLASASTITFNVLATNGTCTPLQLTDTENIVVNGTINNTFAVTPQDPTICEGTSTVIVLANSENGVLYQLLDNGGNPVGAQQAGATGTPINFNTNSLTSTETFTISATNGSCTIVLTDDATVTVNTTPVSTIAVSGPPPICTGGTANISIVGSQIGVSYQLRNDLDDSNSGLAVVGTGGNITLVSDPLTVNTNFNILASIGACPSVELTTIVSVAVGGTIDATKTLTAANTTICEGTSTTIDVVSPEVGVNYTLRNDADDSVLDGPFSGTVSFNTGNLAASTTFNVLADNGTCTIELTNKLTIQVDASPSDLDLDVSISPVCVSNASSVVVKNSQLNVSYQLRLEPSDVAVGTAVIGTGADIALPTDALAVDTDFNVLATNGVCSPIQLSEIVTVLVGAGTLNTGLTTTATPIAPICENSSAFIQVLNSELGVSYQLRNNEDDAVIGSAVTSTSAGSTVNLPTGNLSDTTTFNVLASIGTCSAELADLETITVIPIPDNTVAVSASNDPNPICPGNSVTIIVASENGVSYQLRNNADNSLIGTAVVGDGTAINLPTGILTSTTTFNVLASVGTCSAELTDTATVTVRSSSDPLCTGCLLLIPVASKVDATCNGVVDGSITISSVVVIGSPATLPYSYSIDNGVTFQASSSFPNLEGGKNYSLIVKDAGTCVSSVSSISINNTAEISATIDKTNVLTCGAADGMISITAPTGSTSPSPVYSFSIDNGANFQPSGTFTLLNVNTYEVVISDNLGCLSEQVLVEIDDPSCGGGGGGIENCTLFNVSISEVKPTCSGEDDGQLIFNITGGTPLPNYTFLLIDTVIVNGNKVINSTGVNRPPSTDILFTGLRPAHYRYRITDGVGNFCTLPYRLRRQVNIDASATPGAPVCFGQSTGSAEVTVSSGGNAPFEYSIDGGLSFSLAASSVFEVSGLTGGSKSILIRDDATDDCPSEVQFFILDFPDIQFTTSATSATTCTSNDGSISVTGDPGDEVALKDANGNIVRDFTPLPMANPFNGLASGSYTVVVKNFNDCEKELTQFVPAPNQLSAFVAFQDALCANNAKSGILQVDVDETVVPGPYTLTISKGTFIPEIIYSEPYNGEAFQLDTLVAGSYIVTVQPENTAFCSETINGTIQGPIAISLEPGAVCFGTDILLQNIQGDVSLPFTVEVRNAGTNSVVFQDTNVNIDPFPLNTYAITAITNPFLSEPGSYVLVLRQQQGTCPLTYVSDPFMIGAPIVAEVSTPEPLRTYESPFADDPSAARFISVVGGAPGYSMSLLLFGIEVRESVPVPTLNTGINYVQKYFGLGPGDYTAVVTDQLGCVSNKNFSIATNTTDVFIPNIFTPDGDGFNSTFFIRNLGASSKLMITNRWGNEVYSSSAYENDWDAEGVSDGVYYYRLQTGGQEYSGWVEVLRGKKP
jgi:hypothetical protein